MSALPRPRPFLSAPVRLGACLAALGLAACLGPAAAPPATPHEEVLNTLYGPLWVQRRGPWQIEAGQPFSSTLTLVNRGHKSMPAGDLSLDPGPDFTWVGASDGGRMSDGRVLWHLPALAPGERWSAELTGQVRGRPRYRDQLACFGAAGGGLDLPVVAPQLSVQALLKQQNNLYEPVAVEFQVQNTGAAPARGARIGGELPAGWSVDGGGHKLDLSLGEIPPGGSRSVRAALRASALGPAALGLRASSAGAERDFSAATTVVAEQLAVSGVVPPAVPVARDIRHVLRVANKGNDTAAGTRLTLDIPAGARFLGASHQGRLEGGQVVWELGDIAPGDQREVKALLAADNPCELSTRALAANRHVQADTSSRTRVDGVAALSLEVVDLRDPVPVGEETTYRVRVTNQGSAPAHQVRIQARMDPAQEFVSAGGSSALGAAGAVLGADPLPLLGPGASAEWLVRVRAARPADARFSVDLLADELQRSAGQSEPTRQYE